ncbi:MULTISPECIES: hypothetical protein [Pedobacter]|uniref:Lipoprotein n=1 Tax=Pedobacter heparinus (strain ATCC 13125 / DSM 2366 / CIP 104194 / JCM 7457 / NBRC 12017 / NCIMB 9290 / NRRL B-14731 / HIM 762-3) TaxID=485917 RepID=C6XZW8_PEDHD|nr:MULTISPECIES: hypothetical protein [Pedobacter]ACU02663.1 hypothetical protein Phep_0439 [Pedobacter heparinus DSM 2366]MBB5439846.1 hypothetical protein [Pedobacter sp. AK017]
MKHTKTYLLVPAILLLLVLVSSCSKETVPYDHPFFHINFDSRSRIEVLSNRKDTVSYKVYLSSSLQFEPIDLTYEVIVGDGLQENRDFVLITKGPTLTFPQGIFERPIKIAWKESVLDPAKNNTLTIRLLSNTRNFTLGMPGPDQLERELLIIKK